jgi:hypothetical protein
MVLIRWSQTDAHHVWFAAACATTTAISVPLGCHCQLTVAGTASDGRQQGAPIRQGRAQLSMIGSVFNSS